MISSRDGMAAYNRQGKMSGSKSREKIFLSQCLPLAERFMVTCSLRNVTRRFPGVEYLPTVLTTSAEYLTGGAICTARTNQEIPMREDESRRPCEATHAYDFRWLRSHIAVNPVITPCAGLQSTEYQFTAWQPAYRQRHHPGVLPAERSALSRRRSGYCRVDCPGAAWLLSS